MVRFCNERFVTDKQEKRRRGGTEKAEQREREKKKGGGGGRGENREKAAKVNMTTTLSFASIYRNFNFGCCFVRTGYVVDWTKEKASAQRRRREVQERPEISEDNAKSKNGSCTASNTEGSNRTPRCEDSPCAFWRSETSHLSGESSMSSSDDQRLQMCGLETNHERLNIVSGQHVSLRRGHTSPHEGQMHSVTNEKCKEKTSIPMCFTCQSTKEASVRETTAARRERAAAVQMRRRLEAMLENLKKERKDFEKYKDQVMESIKAKESEISWKENRNRLAEESRRRASHMKTADATSEDLRQLETSLQRAREESARWKQKYESEVSSLRRQMFELQKQKQNQVDEEQRNFQLQAQTNTPSIDTFTVVEGKSETEPTSEDDDDRSEVLHDTSSNGCVSDVIQSRRDMKFRSSLSQVNQHASMTDIDANETVAEQGDGAVHRRARHSCVAKEDMDHDDILTSSDSIEGYKRGKYHPSMPDLRGLDAGLTRTPPQGPEKERRALKHLGRQARFVTVKDAAIGPAEFRLVSDPTISQADEADAVLLENLRNAGNAKQIVCKHQFENGTVRWIHANGGILTEYHNGDVKQRYHCGIEEYYWKKPEAWEVSYPSGIKVMYFPCGKVEAYLPSGVIEVLLPTRDIAMRRNLDDPVHLRFVAPSELCSEIKVKKPEKWNEGQSMPYQS